MFLKKKRNYKSFNRASKGILLVCASNGSTGDEEEGNWMIVQVVMVWSSCPSQRHLKTVLRIEKYVHFLASVPFAIRNRIAEMAICNGKQD